MTYCIDTSALLDAGVRWYPQDTFPSLWEKLSTLVDTGSLIATEEVLHELERKEGDVVYQWARAQPDMFVPLDATIQNAVTHIMAQHPQLVDARTGKSFADPFVIATAHVRKCVVITGEKPTHSATRPKIPDVCSDMRIACIGFMDLIRRERWRF